MNAIEYYEYDCCVNKKYSYCIFYCIKVMNYACWMIFYFFGEFIMTTSGAKKPSLRRRKSPAKKNKISEDSPIVGAAKKLSPEVLDALAYGYIVALEHSDQIDNEKFDTSNLDFEPDADSTIALEGSDLEDLELMSFQTISFGGSNKAEVLSFENISDVDIIGDVVACIFTIFNKNDIPITTSTKPSSIMAMKNWITIGRAILSCVAKKYPEFGQVARPSRLPRFYNHSLSTMAGSIRDSIEKRR